MLYYSMVRSHSTHIEKVKYDDRQNKGSWEGMPSADGRQSEKQNFSSQKRSSNKFFTERRELLSSFPALLSLVKLPQVLDRLDQLQLGWDEQKGVTQSIRFVTGRPDRNIHRFNKLNSPQLVRFTHRQPYYSLLIRLPAFSDARPRSWPAPFIMTLRSVSLPSQCDSIRTLIDMLQFFLESRYLAHRHSLFICLYERAISFVL